MIKDVVKNLSLSSTLRINEISKELESKGKEIFKFGFGQSPFEVPENVVEELKKNVHQNNYLSIQGLNELRNVISKFISLPSMIFFTANSTIFPFFVLGISITLIILLGTCLGEAFVLI